jgi:hypothetical protein
MVENAVVKECRAALQAAVGGALGMLTVARSLLDRMESGPPLSADAIAEYRRHFEETEEQLAQLQAVVDRWTVLVSGPVTLQ